MKHGYISIECNNSFESINQLFLCPILNKNGILKRSTKGAQNIFKEYESITKESKPIVDFSIPISESQYLKGSINSPKGSPDRTPNAEIRRTLG